MKKLIDRRFLNARITVKGFASSAPSEPGSGDQYIVSEAWGSSYPDAIVNSIAINASGGWEFVKPNAYRSLEVINIATGEILKYYDSNNDPRWEAISTIGGLILPYVVDRVVTSASELQSTYGKIGLTYIYPGEDNKVWKVTGSGENDRTSLDSLAVGNKVGVISTGYIYKVTSNSESTAFDSDYDYIPAHTLVLSVRTQCAYLSANYTGYALVSLTPHRSTGGESQGSIVIERHVFTAAEISAKRVEFNNNIADSNLNKVMCVLNGNIHMHETDFYAENGITNNDSYLYIYWDSSFYSWYDSGPREGEVGIFIYSKE